MVEAAGPVIWVVEDDLSSQRFIAAQLKANGFDPVLFGTAEKAYAALSTQPSPALIILDMLLHGMSGVDLIRLLKQRKEWERIPVVVVTVLSRKEAGLPAEHATFWVNKPFEASTLIKTVQEILAPVR